ncbi:hypothetical protein [Mesorhizobium amorphae]|uniref:hypothetical protein n=1 Tax=Mesorhizobium amorphae TaxID=71433 RepID=UPI001428C1D5|nr:hypothetical protein [Mesorhizobium amorphae]GLR42867.1 hypothetical protein GCM10007880_33830 [Mesorhizobium amorphae]
MRFVAVQEPPDTWAVFDTTVDEPADYSGRVLFGLTSSEAQWFAAVANDEVSWRESNPSGAHQRLVGCSSASFLAGAHSGSYCLWLARQRAWPLPSSCLWDREDVSLRPPICN